MKKINVKTSIGSYPIYLGSNLINETSSFLNDFDCKIMIVCDENTNELFYEKLKIALTDFDIYKTVIKAGEEHKNMSTIMDIYANLSENKFCRKDILIALGGGVVGDMTGFVAATYLRGIDYIGIPTTLLSQVDSSIGGKTGIDLPYGKNLVGAFKNPLMVIADFETLKSLPPIQISSGMAEIIKSAMIRDKELFYRLKSTDDLEDFILSSLLIKKSVVEEDEFEKSTRMLLNFGHTFGHAIEKCYDFKNITHGEAVAIGMCLITKNKSILHELKEILNKYSLPCETHIPMEKLIEATKNDKKSQQDSINIILVDEIGKGKIEKMSFRKLGEIYG